MIGILQTFSHEIFKDIFEIRQSWGYGSADFFRWISVRWRIKVGDGVLSHQPHDCSPKHLFRRRSRKASKLRVTGICEGNSPVTGECSAQRASNAENVSIWWHHHVSTYFPWSYPDSILDHTAYTNSLFISHLLLAYDVEWLYQIDCEVTLRAVANATHRKPLLITWFIWD